MPFQQGLSPQKEHQPQQHANAGGTETVGPAVNLAQPATEQGGREGPDVDAHVENGEAGIPPGIIFRVQLADHG